MNEKRLIWFESYNGESGIKMAEPWATIVEMLNKFINEGGEIEPIIKFIKTVQKKMSEKCKECRKIPCKCQSDNHVQEDK